jgi:hypothetical protein
MSTSRPIGGRPRPTLRAGALEVLGLGVLFALLPQLAEARSGVTLEPHPGWIAVLVLAARYGSGGLFAGLVTAAGAILGATAIAGTGLSSVWRGLDSTPSLIAFGGCLIVSWIASWHLRREAELSRQLDTLRDRSREARAEFQTLSDAVATLRARVDRTSTSLSFLRDVARRLEGRDPVAAAEAAADLALARAGASAATIRVGPGGFQRLLAVRDARGPHLLGSLDARHADLSVPLRDGGDCIGILALWGVSRSDCDEATTHDLGVIASWCARALRPLALTGSQSGSGVM